MGYGKLGRGFRSVAGGLLFGIATLGVGAAGAQAPPEVAAELRALGNGICVPETAAIYKPLLLDQAPYSGVEILRDISYFDDPRTVMDLFAPESGAGDRPVLVFVSGGAGNKQEAPPDGDVFYDNIMMWAVKNGMVGVNMQRRGGLTGAGMEWDEPARDVGRVVAWVRQNIGQYRGDPDRIFLWSSSAGNVPVSTYAAHPEISGANGAAVKGIILMSAPNFNILPATATGPAPEPPAGLGTNCGREPAARGGGAPGGARGAVGRGGGAGRGRGGAGRGGAAAVDEATQLARSNLDGLANGPTAVFVAWGELDPPNIIAFDTGLRDALCQAGRCPTSWMFPDHSHMSLVFVANTEDDSVTGPLLEWMRSVD